MTAQATAVVSVDINGAADAVGVGVDTIRAALKRGDLTARYLDAAPSKPLFLLTELHEWVATSPTTRRKSR